ncbi:MAG: copper amine oxidase N-terminal domain-containing protein [Clostridia bacterium]|nr:copper amine oxidase N-terminal domain-containing protein [Clostridia bacterium]
MKKVLSCIIAMMMLVAVMPLTVLANDNVVYLSTSTGSDDNDGLTPETPKKTWSTFSGKGIMSLLESGGTMVVTGKSYLGGNYTIPRMRGELIITSVYGGVDYKNPKPANNPACAFKMASGAALTIQSGVTFDDIILFQEANQNTIIVEDGGVLTITDKIVCQTNKEYYWNIVVNKGGTAIINGGIFSSITGKGDITIGENVKIHEEVIVDPDAPADGDVMAVFHNSNGNDESDGLTPLTPKKSLGSLTSGLVSLIPRGGTIVTVGKSYISRNFAFPKVEGPVTFTSVYGGVDYKNPEPVTNPACAFKMASGATFTIESDMVFDNIILFQENVQNTIRVTSGASLMVTDTVQFMTKPGNEYHFRIIVDEGSTALLSAEAIEKFDIFGDGEVINLADGESVEIEKYAMPLENATTLELTIGSATARINGLARPIDAAPINRNNRTMLPVRFLANTFGVANEGIKWDAATRTATLSNESVTIVITIDAPSMTVNGATVALDSPAIIENDRTYLPVRAIANALGVSNDNIKWDGATSTATLIK